MSKEKISIILAMFVLNGCSYSINMVHTEGTATDLVDETQTTNPTLTIPIK